MSRQIALQNIWKRLLIVFVALIVVGLGILNIGYAVGGIGSLVFVMGNVGGYVSVHRGLGDLTDAEVIELADSWWPIVAPPFVGGVLAVVLYIAFLGKLLGGDLFPVFEEDKGSALTLQSLLTQHAVAMPDYAKLLFWAFIAGFNQRYVVDIINSIKAK